MATITANAATGNWNANGTWVGSVQPTAADDVVIPSGAVVTIPAAVTAVCRSIDVQSGATLVWAATTSVLTVGNASGGALTFSSGCTITLTGLGTINLVSTSNNSGTGWTVTTGGKTLPHLTCNGAGGKWVLGSALTLSGNYTMSAGTFVSAGYSVTFSTLVSVVAATRVLDFTGSTVTLTATSGTPWNISNTGITLTSPDNLVIGTASSSSRTLTQGNRPHNTITYTVAASTGALIFTGSPTNIADLVVSGGARTVTFTAGQTMTFSDWHVNGAAGALVTVNSTTSGTSVALVKAGGGVVSSDYLSVKDIAASPSTTWYAGTHSTNVSGNSGWVFTAPPAGQTVTLGLASHASSAQPLARVKVLTTGLAQHSTTTASLSRIKLRTVGLASGSNTAAPIARQKARSVGLATHTDVATAFARQKARSVGLAMETAVTAAVGRQKTRATGLPTETATATAIGRWKKVAAGLAVEMDAPWALRAGKAWMVGLANETVAASSLGRLKAHELGLPDTGSSVVAAMGRAKRRALPLVGASDLALPVSMPGVLKVLLGLVVDVATASPFARLKALRLALAGSGDAALAAGRRKARTLELAGETSLPLPITRGVPLVRGDGTARMQIRTVASTARTGATAMATTSERVRGKATIR